MPANDKRVVKVNRRSGYDKHFRNTLTANVGTLVPILVDELCPDSKVNFKINVAASLPPLVSDTYMNVRLRIEAFAVPHRLCQANYDEFFSDFAAKYIADFDPSSDAPIDAPFTLSDDMSACMPLIALGGDYPDIDKVKSFIGNGSLADYMGLSSSLGDGDPDYLVVVSPLTAYHLIWQEWYRNPRVQKPAFSRLDVLNTSQGSNVISGNFSASVCSASLPYTAFYFDDNGTQPTIKPLDSDDYDIPLGEYILADGKNILDLRQRNFGLDFFTAAMLEPQQGPAAVVKFGKNGDPVDGFSIASLRAQNSLQQFRERNNLTSPRYQQQIYARYGCAPTDGIIQRPILIGAATYDVYSHGVTATASTDSPDSGAPNLNPFRGVVGQRSGNGFASGSDFIISGFHTKEPMYLIVLASLVPDVSYSQNMNMIFNRYKGLGSITDLANPILQNVGPQPIPIKLLTDDSVNPEAVFAYTDRYSDWMFKNNEVHGEFKYGGTLANFVSQRYFSSEPEFGSEFLTIPTNYLDDVLQFTSAILGFGYWLDCLLDYKVSMPLQEYAIPSLQDPGYEHGKTIVLRKNGQLL